MDSLRGLMIVFSGGGAEGSLLRSKIHELDTWKRGVTRLSVELLQSVG